MTIHLTEDELVLHYYGELTASEEGRVTTHLTSCAACHDNLRQLQRVLAVVDESALAGPELPEHFERTVWAELEPNLQRTRGGWASWFLLSPGRLAWIADGRLAGRRRVHGGTPAARGRRMARRRAPAISASASCWSISATISTGRRWCSSSS